MVHWGATNVTDYHAKWKLGHLLFSGPWSPIFVTSAPLDCPKLSSASCPLGCWLRISKYIKGKNNDECWVHLSVLNIIFRIWPFDFLPEEKLKLSSSHLKISSAFKQIFLHFCPACLIVLSKRDGLKQADLSLLEADIPQKGRRWRKALQGRG